MQVEKIFKKFINLETIKSIKKNDIGLINKTYFITTNKNKYVLQEISQIFNRENICENIKKIYKFLKNKKDEGKISKDFEILTPVFLPSGEMCLKQNNKIYRLYYFINNSKVLDEINLNNAEKIGEGIGEFYSYLDGFNEELKIPLDNFHDINFYYSEFLNARKKSKKQKNKELEKWFLENENNIKKFGDLIKKSPKKLIHQDIKLANILFDKNSEKVISIIDWDTFYYSSILVDFGDMCRSFFKKTNYDFKIFEKFLDGYFSNTKNLFSDLEFNNLIFSFEMINLELAMRFYIDYLNNGGFFLLEDKLLIQKSLDLLNNQVIVQDNKKNLENIIKKYESGIN